ncbi:MAG TPA: sigma-70 family RNA polymerase sigma factor [Butyricimonas virosa]|uniref:Sigma-70 family RNA polymerase sigma factor n=1 Tax=Butyricimonas virosa TaxID=544645 RepID=A0A921L1A7_9BACT|nr:sigma-70 family RNA polymerase sigma factor [Butyricimonas virosa]
MSGSDNFDSFFKAFFNPICLFIERVMGEKEEVTDLAQDVFFKVFERWKEFDSEENAKAFLYISARNLCFDRLRRKQAENNYVSQYLQENELKTSTFLQEVMRQETFRILYSAIDRLPEQTRQVILLGMDGNSNQEVGELLGVSINTVKTLKKIGYATLREILSKEYLVLLLILLEEF